MKGYVVRGKDLRGEDVAAVGYGTRCRAAYGEHSEYITLDEAAGVRARLHESMCTDVRIFAVAEDGSETPLPTYEEALETLEKLRLAFEYPNTRELWAELRAKVGAP
jgi:hypothetical protein